MKRYWKVAVLANIKDDSEELATDVPPDAYADFDSIETIQAIRDAIESDGHDSQIPMADENPHSLYAITLPIFALTWQKVWVVMREKLKFLRFWSFSIPYTGSRVLTNGISLDKTLTKRIWRDRRLPVASFQEFTTGDEPLRPELKLPLFVKPAREGTGMGVDTKAIVKNEKELRERAKWVIEEYRQPALVEDYLSGREFTVGIGRPD